MALTTPLKLTSINACGECNLCYKLLPINDTAFTEDHSIMRSHCGKG